MLSQPNGPAPIFPEKKTGFFLSKPTIADEVETL
jgi:hypothetical protein